ncbi:MAG: hypothetical protein AAGB93_07775, partial [Planctomycetota bacterium]
MRPHAPTPEPPARPPAQFRELPLVTVVVAAVLVLVVGLRTTPTAAQERGIDRSTPDLRGPVEGVAFDVAGTEEDGGSPLDGLSPIVALSGREGVARPNAGGRTSKEAVAETDDARSSAPGSVRPRTGQRLPASFPAGGHGVAREEGRFHRGVRHGEWVVFRADGTVSERGEYADGLREGLWQTFSGAGALLTEAHFLAGDLHGDWRMYADAGDLVGEGTYRENLRSGRWTL